MLMKAALAGLVFAVSATAASASACDWRPSQFFGSATATVTGGGAAALGGGMKTAGFYTLVHSGSGLTMLGSTLSGASGAGTIGIIGGTGGLIGTVSAILMSPVTFFAGSLIVVGSGAGESRLELRV